MKKTILSFTAAIVALSLSLMFQGCKPTSADKVEDSTPRGAPVLQKDTLIYDESTQTFTLKLRADSIAGAEVTYSIFDGDSLISQNSDGVFTGIKPLENGYFVKLRAEWSDTIIETTHFHFGNFVIPREPVEPLTKEDLQKIINAKDKDAIVGDKEHFVQDYKVKVVESRFTPTSLIEVFQYLKFGMWQSVVVTDVAYDDNNLITTLTLKPVGEQAEPEEEDEVFEEDY